MTRARARGAYQLYSSAVRPPQQILGIGRWRADVAAPRERQSARAGRRSTDRRCYRCYRSTPQTSSRSKPTTQPGSKSSISSAGGRAPNTCPSNRSGGSTFVTLTLKGVPLCCNITTVNLAIVSFGVAATRLAAGVSPLLDDPNLLRLSHSGYLTISRLLAVSTR